MAVSPSPPDAPGERPTAGLALPPLVDSHCHLTWQAFQGDLDAVVERARGAGVAQVVVVATDAETAEAGAALCRGRPGLHPTAGIHPNDLPDAWEAEFARCETLLRTGGFVAVGETGLDYFRDAVPPARQRAAFLAQAGLARDLDLPVVVHIRDREGRFEAYDDVARVLGDLPGVRGVIHCYTGDPAHAEAYLALGFLVSFSGILTFPKGENVRASARVVPLERTLVETDAPFLSPIPRRGERCEPAYVAHTARRLAEVKGVPEAEVRGATTAAARRLFRLPEA